jgi:hypothetical protein
VREVAVDTPSTGVINVGLLLKTRSPVPVSSLITPANCAEVVEANWLSGLAVRANPAKLGGVVQLVVAPLLVRY